MDLARQALAALEPGALDRSGLHDVTLLPIAATTVDLDLFVTPVVDGNQGSPVVWFAGSEVDRFGTFREFILAMIEYNARELAALTGRSEAAPEA